MRKAFTLIELVIIIAIIGILAAIAIPRIYNAVTSAQQAKEDEIVNAVRAGIENYYAQTSAQGNPSYPSTLDNARNNTCASVSNPFFTNVLKYPVEDSNWCKNRYGHYYYTRTYRDRRFGCSRGRYYSYDRTTGKFTRRCY